MQKVEIDRNKVLEPGDVIELHFKSVGMAYLKASQIAVIEWRLQGKKEFDILSWSIPGEKTVVFKVLIKKTNPIIITASVVAAAIVAAGVVAWLLLDKVYQIMESPTGKAVVGSTAVGFAAIAIMALLGLAKK